MKRSTLLALLVTSIFAACKKDDNSTINPPPASTTDTLTGTVTSDLSLDAAKSYLVDGQVYVKNNANLTIPAGTTLMFSKNDDAANKSSLIISQGSKININGTADKPVVFTSAAATKAPGDWGALVILGKAVTNTVTGYAEGLAQSDDTKYGGTANDDNSGVITYLRLEYAGGINADAENEWKVDKVSGLVLASVGSGTTVNHVMVSHSRDDGYQFVGGTVNATHLIAFNNGDDDYDFDLGYTGKLQYLISYRTRLDSEHALRANGFESYNDEVPTLNAPLTRPVVSNMTIVGPSGMKTEGNHLNQGVYIRKGTRFVIQNSIVAEYPMGALMVCNKTRPVLLNNTGSLFKYNIVHSDSASRTFSWDKDYAVFGDDELKTFALNDVNHNTMVENSSDLLLKALYSDNTPDLTPADGSAALSGANFEGNDYSSFFEIVPYRGAIGNNNWAAAGSWAVWQ